MAVQRSWFRKRLVLSSAIFVAVFFFLAALHSCNGSAKPAPSVSNNEVIDPAVAKTLYNVKCGICHGADGAMNYAGAKDLTISTLPRAEVIAQITYGKGTMPPMKTQLTTEQIEAVSDYCISLRVK